MMFQKHTATKTFLVRNVGEKAQNLHCRPVTRSMSNHEITVAQGASIQVTVMFTPDVARAYEGEMTLLRERSGSNCWNHWRSAEY